MARQDVELKFSLIDGVSRNLGEIQKGVSGLGAQMVKLNASADLTGKAFGAIGAVAGAFGDAITGAASVEDALTRVNTITGATIEEQKALQEAVRGAVDGTRFSAQEAAGALVLLAEDGFSAREAVDQLGAVLQFAQANAQSAAQAATALGAVLDTYGEKPQIIGELADKLTAVAVAAGTSTKSLQEGLSGVGNAADQAGLSLDQTIGYLGLLASRGIEGGAAVGQFSKIIREISDPASKAGEALAALGLQGADFSVVMQRLGTDGVAAEKVLSALGKKPREALRALLTEGGGDLGKFRKVLDESAGATRAASDALNENFAGALARIQNQLVQTRNELLTPILLPLADEVQALSTRLSEFAQSPEFDLLVENFTRIASAGIKGFGDFLASVDFTDALAKVVDFSTTAAENLATIAKAFEITGRIIGGFGDLVSITFNSIKGVTADVAAALIEPLAVFDEGAKGVWLSLKSQAEESTQSVSVSLGKLGERFTGAASSADRFRDILGQTSAAAKVAATRNRDLAESLIPAPFLAVADAALAAAREIEGLRVPPEAAKISLGNLAQGADSASLSLNALEARLKAVREALANAPQGSPEFIRFAQDAAKLEEQIKLAKVAIDEASGANDRLAGSSDRASQSMRNQASAARDSADAGERVAQTNSQVSDSFGNINGAASEAAISLGNMSEAYARLAIEAAGAQTSQEGYVETLNSFFNAAAEQDRLIADRIDRLSRQNAALDEESLLRRRLELQYGTSSTRLEELVQLELKLAEVKRRSNDEAERGIEIEQRRAGQAGGIGGSRGTGAADETAAAVGGRNVAGGGEASRSAGSQVVNVTISGLPADRAGWRDAVAQFIVPEIERINRLSR